MTVKINSVNEVLERMDDIAERKKELDTTLRKLILDDELRNILDEAVFGPVDELLEESKNILRSGRDEARRR